tara:strand:- start:13 stop:681 length:669 start_codon:yes stop_codon:yes gene_type:complete
MMDKKKIDKEFSARLGGKRTEKRNEKVAGQIKEVQAMGLMQGVDLENKTPLEVKEDYTGEMVALEVNNRDNSPARYTLAQKSSAIFFMKCMQRPNKQVESGYIPMYDEVSLSMGIKKSTLQSWWKDKAKYEADADEMKVNLIDHVSEFQMIQLLKVQKELDSRSLKEFSNKELLNYYDAVMNIMMRLSNLASGGGAPGTVNQNNSVINLVLPKENRDKEEIK